MLFRATRCALKPHLHRYTPSQLYYIPLRTFLDEVEIQFVRDKGLDHAVEKETNLQPLIGVKNLIKSEPSKSIPLSSIVDNREKLRIPTRPIEFVRSYPTVFEEYFPGNIRIHPHVRLTPEALDLNSEEQLMYQSDTFRQGAADRLLKLLMLCEVNEIPLNLIDRLKWDLGLPDDYVKSLVPDFPDYFQVKSVKGSRNFNSSMLELVCWDRDSAVSVMEKKAAREKKAAMNKKNDYEKGKPLEFPMLFSKGFEMDKKLKKLIDDWQKLPYVSPYTNASHLQPNSDESDRWAVGVLHEFLHILVPKKTDREHILTFGEYLGIRSRFKRAVVHHPGIFYLSSKAGTYTVVLKEGYKRGSLIDKHSLMEMRNRYIHLMNKGKDVGSPKTGHNMSKKPLKREDWEDEVGNVSEDEQDEESDYSESDDEVENKGKYDNRNKTSKHHSRAVGFTKGREPRKQFSKDNRRVPRSGTRRSHSHKEAI